MLRTLSSALRNTGSLIDSKSARSDLEGLAIVSPCRLKELGNSQLNDIKQEDHGANLAPESVLMVLQ